MSKPHVDAARRRVSTHVAKRVNCPRAAGIRACCALTSRRLATSGTSKPHVDAARRWVSTCSETSEMSASAGIRAYFALTSPRLVTSGMSKPHVDAARRRVSTHVAKRVNCPRAAGIRGLFCSHIISFHHISNSGSRSVASQRRITSHSPCRRCMSQAPAQCFSSAKQGDRDGF